jgi:chlorophyllide a hydrolase
MDVRLEKNTRTKSEVTYVRMGMAHPERAILIYWGIALVVGALVLRSWLGTWNVATTFSHPALVAYLVLTFGFSQALYVLVARHDDRPVLPLPTVIFSLGNGFFETLSFAAVYWLGSLIGASLVGLFAPAAASVAGFALGLVFFCIFGGLIHGLFWLPLLPPHFDESPRSQAIRKFRPIAEVALVLGWCLCLWLFNDIWTVILFHTLVDVGLMLRVRPVLFHR